ncbi:Endoglucanase precursor [Raoultella terrigena]|uniref:cellulase n=1 Tax=Raoultella terrigena TaxID=577 RepID=A0A4U9D486_RAOTE|nr:Endoglucanase precursor [Raoultella terrigena]
MPGLGPMVLPGKVGFADDKGWRLTPATSRRSWRTILSATAPRGRSCAMAISACWLETAPKGFSPDWVRYEKGKGWELKADKPIIGSYDAIRVYLWVGMLNDGDKQKTRLLAHF